MMTVKVKSKDAKFSIPVPYIFFNIAISILTSRRFQQKVNKWIKESYERKKQDVPFTFPQIDKKTLKPIAKELKKYRGMVLVDVSAKDGSRVKIKL